MKAQKLGRLYVPFDEGGHPLEERVGRHSSAMQSVIRAIEYFFDYDQTIRVTGVPGYQELMDNGLGAYLRDPAAN